MHYTWLAWLACHSFLQTTLSAPTDMDAEFFPPITLDIRDEHGNDVSDKIKVYHSDMSSSSQLPRRAAIPITCDTSIEGRQFLTRASWCAPRSTVRTWVCEATEPISGERIEDPSRPMGGSISVEGETATTSGECQSHEICVDNQPDDSIGWASEDHNPFASLSGSDSESEADIEIIRRSPRRAWCASQESFFRIAQTVLKKYQEAPLAVGNRGGIGWKSQDKHTVEAIVTMGESSTSLELPQIDLMAQHQIDGHWRNANRTHCRDCSRLSMGFPDTTLRYLLSARWPSGLVSGAIYLAFF